jgi:hypothetical protein
MKFKDIVNEIAWKCKDGMPNFNRADDVMLLKNQLIKEGWSLEAIYALIDKLSEDDIVQKKQKDGSYGKSYTVKKHSPDRGQKLVKKDASPEDIKKLDKDEPEDKEEEELSVDKHDDLKKEHWSPKFKKEIKGIEENLKKSKDPLETEEAKKRIEGYKNTSRDITESTGIPLHLGSSASEEEKFNLANAIFSKREVQQKYYYDVVDRPKGSRAKSIKKLAEDLKAKGYTINKVTSKHLTAWTPEGKYISVHSKPTIVGKSKRGESTAYEGVVALAYALGESEYTEEEIPEILESLMKEGTVTTKNGMVVNIADLRADALKYFTNPENLESMANKLKDILSNKNVAVEIAVAKDLLEKGNFPEGTKIKVDCEGGTDDDKFRADIVIYAETPDGERTALLASSVKDGKNVQLAQLGPRRAVDAINDTEPGSDERREMILHHPTDKSAYIHQIQKLPESMQGAYMERIMQAENPDELHIELMNGVLDAADDDPRAIYDFMMFSIVGHDPPEGVGSFLYQNAGKVSRVPLTGSKEAEKMVSKITELYESGRIRKSENPKKGDFLMYIDDDGKEIPLLKTRSKYTEDGNLERVLVEKGGTKSALLKLLSGELD